MGEYQKGKIRDLLAQKRKKKDKIHKYSRYSKLLLIIIINHTQLT